MNTMKMIEPPQILENPQYNLKYTVFTKNCSPGSRQACFNTHFIVCEIHVKNVIRNKYRVLHFIKLSREKNTGPTLCHNFV